VRRSALENVLVIVLGVGRKSREATNQDTAGFAMVASFCIRLALPRIGCQGASTSLLSVNH